MKMKSKILTLFLAVIMIVSTSIPAFAANSIGVTYEIKLTPENLTVSSSPQTVTMEINATTQIDWDGIQAKIYIPTGFKLKSIANKEVTLKASDFNLEPGAVSGKGSLGFQSESGENEKITNICVVIYEIAADTPAGTYKLGVEQLEITKDYGEIWESEGVVTKDFVITSGTPAPSDPAKPTINITGTYTYNGSEQTANVTGYDPATMNITGNKGTNAGEYTASVTSKTGKWADGTSDAVTKGWSIAKATPTVTNPTGLTGTKGNALSTVTLPTGWAWKTPTTVMNTTGNQTFAAIYTPTDTTNYNTKEANLTVNVSEPPATDPAKPTINVTGTYTYTGSEQTATVTGYDSATMNISGNKGTNAGNYTMSVTSKTGQWADGSSDAVTKAWSIAKADPTVTNPTGLTGTKGNALSTVTLPANWAWKAPTTVMNTSGNQSFAAVFTPTDTTNYNTKEANLTVNVSEPPATDPAKPTINVTGTYTYTGSEQTATVTGYDSATMNISGNKETNAGNYTVSVTSKTGQWADGSSDAVTKAWSIAKATPTGTPTYTSITVAGKTLADAALTENFSVPGSVKWVADDGSDLADTTTVAANTYYKWLFTPTDADNYETLTGTIKLYSKSSGGGGGTTRYTVKFETNGGSKITSQSVTRNTAMKEPTAPTKDGYTFAGWYSDKELKTAYDFSAKVTKSFTLYAKWTEKATEPDKPTEPVEPTEPTAPEWKNPFTDVKKSDWFYTNVEYAVNNKLMNGTTATTFAPNEPLTRGMLVAILYRAEGEPAVNKSIPFSDVDANAYYSNAVVWAQQNGIVNGVTENEFAPENNITREQIAAIMFRFAKYKGYDVSVGENTNILSYTDAESISEYAISAMQYVVGSGLMKGKTESTINPKDNATRAEIAAILQRFIEANK